ncbi:MAG: PilZ domain-containing protein [Desulfobacterales bacterium]|nr:PilZ domain-containing protein [Desulfobacterales bacterium]MBF0399111.1 PilZ domain-containing protein [Desulfobacterales bacterium]
MSKQSINERREKIRVDFNTKIVLKVGSSEFRIDGSSKDLSLNGVFINTTENIPTGEKCSVEVHLSGMTEDITLEMKGKTTRKDKGGIAVAFESMDLDSYTHLKNIVKYNSSNPDEIF